MNKKVIYGYHCRTCGLTGTRYYNRSRGRTICKFCTLVG